MRRTDGRYPPIEAHAIKTAEARPSRTTACADITRANATPNSDIEIRIPAEKTAINERRSGSG